MNPTNQFPLVIIPKLNSEPLPCQSLVFSYSLPREGNPSCFFEGAGPLNLLLPPVPSTPPPSQPCEVGQLRGNLVRAPAIQLPTAWAPDCTPFQGVAYCGLTRQAARRLQQRLRQLQIQQARQAQDSQDDSSSN